MGGPAYSIRTARLLIRCYEPKDAFLLKHSIDESLDHLIQWMQWAENEPEDIEIKIERIRKNRVNFDLGNNYNYGIFLPDNSKLIGSIALMKRVGNGALEIGYWIHADYINKGYATEAASAITRIAFEVEGIERVEIHCDINNIASANIPKKLGYKNEAVIRLNEKDYKGNRKQDMVWILFKDEYQASALPNFSMEAYDVIGRKITLP